MNEKDCIIQRIKKIGKKHLLSGKRGRVLLNPDCFRDETNLKFVSSSYSHTSLDTSSELLAYITLLRLSG